MTDDHTQRVEKARAALGQAPLMGVAGAADFLTRLLDVPQMIEDGELEVLCIVHAGEEIRVARAARDDGPQSPLEEAQALIQTLLNTAAAVAADNDMDLQILDLPRRRQG